MESEPKIKTGWGSKLFAALIVVGIAGAIFYLAYWDEFKKDFNIGNEPGSSTEEFLSWLDEDRQYNSNITMEVAEALRDDYSGYDLKRIAIGAHDHIIHISQPECEAFELKKKYAALQKEYAAYLTDLSFSFWLASEKGGALENGEYSEANRLDGACALNANDAAEHADTFMVLLAEILWDEAHNTSDDNGGTTSDSAAIKDTIKGYYSAFSAEDWNAWLSYIDDTNNVGTDRILEITKAWRRMLGKVTVNSITNIDVKGSTATATAHITIINIGESETEDWQLVKKDGNWKIPVAPYSS